MKKHKKKHTKQLGFWQEIGTQFMHRRLGIVAAVVLALFVLVGIYAPFLASGKPIIVRWQGQWYFPLFRYLFFPGYYSSLLDRFYNLLMFTFPVMVASFFAPYPWKKRLLVSALAGQCILFALIVLYPPPEPDASPHLTRQRSVRLQLTQTPVGVDAVLAPLPVFPTWTFELQHMNQYAKLNIVLDYVLTKKQHERLSQYQEAYGHKVLSRWLGEQARRRRIQLLTDRTPSERIPSEEELRQQIFEETDPEKIKNEIALPSPWQHDQEQQREKRARLNHRIEQLQPEYINAKNKFQALQELCKERNLSQTVVAPNGMSRQSQDYCSDLAHLSDSDRQQLMSMRQIVIAYEEASASRRMLEQRRSWLEEQAQHISYLFMPLFRPYHWEEDAGGEQALNRYVDWWELTRPGRKDLAAALLFGIRISLVVGITAVAFALSIGVPVGAFSGFYGGKADIIVCRIMEVWESMPTFFMLLLIVGITQSKSIFLVIGVIGLFGWTGFSRFLRGEFLKQRNLPYVEACRSMGFRDRTIMFRHILPNAIPPLLTLLPFAIMGAITTEAGLSFLGLGEEGSCSWGVLMDEGRRAFPGESYLLWPPAILLTTLLVAIALVGDALRDALDPRLRR